jgi:hypothetical protein
VEKGKQNVEKGEENVEKGKENVEKKKEPGTPAFSFISFFLSFFVWSSLFGFVPFPVTSCAH